MIQTSAQPETIFPPLLAGYQRTGKLFDESFDAMGALRPHYRKFLDALGQISASELQRRWENSRRLINEQLLAQIVRVLKPGGRLRFATDWADYAAWTLERALKIPGLAWSAERADDWRTPPPDHVTTRYEDKRLGDCAPVFLEFERV